MALAYLGLGSNVGDRAAMLAAAVDQLRRAAGVRVLRQSQVYETEPVGVRDQPWFLNAVVEVETELEPEALRQRVKQIEAALGRTPGPRWGPRVIDVDILLYDSAQVRSDTLVIPHPEMWNRLFVLVPLQELCPDLQAPGGVSIRARIEELSGSSCIRQYEP